MEIKFQCITHIDLLFSNVSLYRTLLIFFVNYHYFYELIIISGINVEGRTQFMCFDQRQTECDFFLFQSKLKPNQKLIIFG